jgi:predicted secreted protein
MPLLKPHALVTVAIAAALWAASPPVLAQDKAPPLAIDASFNAPEMAG